MRICLIMNNILSCLQTTFSTHPLLFFHSIPFLLTRRTGSPSIWLPCSPSQELSTQVPCQQASFLPHPLAHWQLLEWLTSWWWETSGKEAVLHCLNEAGNSLLYLQCHTQAGDGLHYLLGRSGVEGADEGHELLLFVNLLVCNSYMDMLQSLSKFGIDWLWWFYNSSLLSSSIIIIIIIVFQWAWPGVMKWEKRWAHS